MGLFERVLGKICLRKFWWILHNWFLHSCHLNGFTNQKPPFRLARFLKMKEMRFLLNPHVWNFKHIYGPYVTGLIIQKMSDFTLSAAMGSLKLGDEMQAEQTSFVKPFSFFFFFLIVTSSMKLCLDVLCFMLSKVLVSTDWGRFMHFYVLTSKLIYIYSYNCPCIFQFVSLYK